MSKYRITIEGKTYEMEIEMISENVDQQPVIKNKYEEFKNVSKDANVNIVNPSTQKKSSNNLGIVSAPMPGTVIKIEKKKGQTVMTGDVVVVLEAMKMENEIVAPQNGKITELNCNVGETVSSGDVLFKVE